MPTIEELQEKFSRDEFELSRHAVDQTMLREISIQEIRSAMRAGEVIEDYPDDKYGPSCLVFGITNEGRPLHIQCSYPSRPLVKVVTVYEPDPNKWFDFKIRR